ncbi:MAG TPA: amino acid adenylation domain-containing protein [Thermoanaerobaculia bacterium]|nr:amino acid adenylation domain-containing protein [Thermoanaerobaculia bacterium]
MSDLAENLASLSPERRALLALKLRQKQVASPPVERPIPRRPTAGPAPLSFAQERFWLLHQLDPEVPWYHLFKVIHLHGPLDPAAMAASLRDLVHRHEALRTVFVVVDGQPVQMAAPGAHPGLPVLDLAALPAAAREGETQRLAEATVVERFDLAAALPLRARLLRLGEEHFALVLVMHHIVSDRRSWQIFIQELSTIYQARRAGRPGALPEPSLQYADFAAWQRAGLRGETLAADLAYWRRRLAGTLPVLDLPAYRSRSPVRNNRGARHVQQLSRALSQALFELAQRQGASLFMTLLAGFFALLGRYSGSRDLVVGSPVTGRGRPELEGLIGCFLNTLALRADLSGDPSFGELLGRVRETAASAYAHRDLPFEALLEELRPERDLSRTPLFQVMFVLLDLGASLMEGVQLEDLRLTEVENLQIGSEYDLTLNVDRQGRQLRCDWVFATDLLDASEVRRMAGHFETLLAGLAADPTCRLSELPLLTPAEAHAVAFDWNDTLRPPAGMPVHELVAAAAQSLGEAVAVTCSGEHLTYGELVRRASSFAGRLAAAGVGTDVLVGLCLERSLALPITLLAVLTAGGAYLPLDPDYPRERLSYVLQDSRVPLLVTENRLLSRLPEHGARVVLVDEAPSDRTATGSAPALRPTAAHLAYVIYTSGSTGRPKGVAVSHGALANFLLSMCDRPGLATGDRLLAITSLSFDIAGLELYLPLLAGATIELADHETVSDGVRLLARLEGAGVTVLQATPSTFRLLLAAGWPSGRTPLKVLCGGEELPRALAAELLDRAAELWNVYGPTETAIWSLRSRVATGGEGPVSIGRPIDSTRVYLVDLGLRPVPVGVAGELTIGGGGLARGYLGRPELTAERFVPDPTGADPGARVYRTGDLARYRPDGALEFLGRIDQQVKVRGHRVELGEIEAALGRHPAVSQAVVTARADGGTGTILPCHLRLIAYLVPREPAPVPAPTSAELRAFLKQWLPEAMLPAVFVALPALPLTPNGKVDRRALPSPEPVPADRTGLVPPRTPVEAALARIWCEVLRLPAVGVHDNFFELGGDSILGMQIVSRAARAGLGIAPRQLFQHPTVAALAAVADPEPAVVREQGLVLGAVALAPGQREILALHPVDPRHQAEALLLAVEQSFPAALWEEAVSRLLLHHDALRLRYTAPVAAGEGWRATSAGPEGEVPFSFVALAGTPEEQETALAACVAALRMELDLAAGPLVRAALFRLGPGRPDRLLLVAHHLVADRPAWRLLLADLMTACEQLARGEEVRLPAKTTSFQHWTERLAGEAASLAVEEDLAFWRGADGQRAGALPVDHPGGDNRAASERAVVAQLTVEETDRLARGLELYRASLDEGLLTALAQALTTWSGAPAAYLALSGAGREVPLSGVDLSRSVGCFDLPYPMLIATRGVEGDLGELLKWVKEQTRAVPRQGLAWVLVPDHSAPRPEVVFRFPLGADGLLPADAWLTIEAEQPPTASPVEPRPYLLEVEAGLRSGRLELALRYSAGLYRAATIEALADRVLSLLRELAEQCASARAGRYTPSDFPLSGLGVYDLERLVSGLDRQLADHIEAIYPFSPSQQGMFFFYMLNPEQSGLFVNQVSCELQGELDPVAFRRAWEAVVERHAALRTFLVWEGWDKPLSVVCSRVELPWREEDWRGLGEEESRGRLAAFLHADRQRTFDLVRPPLVRLALLRLADDRYRLVWSFHQLILDGWSLPLVFGEVFALYDAALAGRAPDLPAPRPFGDYIAWVERQSQEAAESYWREQLRGFSAPTPLGVDRAPDASADNAADRVDAPLDRAASARLQALARRSRLTLNTLVQGAWAVLLSRYSAETDLVFGAVVSGRPPDLPGIESMVGLFISALPVRVEVAPGEQLLPWLAWLQDQQAEQRQYEHIPLEQVQRWSELSWDSPLFESLLVFENYPIESALGERPRGLAVDRVRVEERPNYPLNLFAIPGPPLFLWVSYERRRFEAVAIQRLLGHLLQLLRGFADEPERRLGELSLLSSAEIHQLLCEWGDTAAEPETATAIQQLFEARAAANPAALAVAFAGEELDYGELNRRANQLAHHLQAQGIGPEKVVAICLERSFDLIVSVLAVWKSGGAYLPVDAVTSAQRLDYILTDAGVSVLLTSERLIAELPLGEAVFSTVLVDADRESIARQPDNDPPVSTTAESLCYLIYTSGSTGRPKGVMVSHGGLINAYRGWEHGYALERAATCHLQMAAFSFDVFAGDFVRALCSGARLVLCPRELLLEADKLFGLMLRERVDAAEFVPAVVRGLLRYLEDSPGALAFMRLMVVGSDAFYIRELAELRRLCGGGGETRVINSYGVSEATIDSSFYDGDGDGLPLDSLVPIGRSFNNSRLYVFALDLEPLPIGVAGELCLGGRGLARGYLGRPDLTAEKFVPDALSGLPGARLYRTGDRARWLPDGNVEFLGRVDHQVKVRGFRVEPGEIESVLGTHSAVAQAAVVAWPESSGERRLVAYVVGREAVAPTVGELREFLRQQLPDYMVPSAFMTLPALPLTASGKIDRRSLPKPDQQRSQVEDTYVAPRSRIEELLAEIYSEVLGIARVGVEDNFFELGGHSLLATQVLSRVRSTFEVNLPLRALFEAPKISALAVRIEQQVLADLEELSDEEAESLA